MSALGIIAVVFRGSGYRYLAIGFFTAALALYAFLLPSAYTAGRIGLVSLRYLNVELAVFSFLLSALLSLTLTLNIYTFRNSRRRSGGLTLGALASSILPSSLCCTTLIPSLLAFVGASTAQIFGLSGRIQGVVATYELAFLGFAAGLLVVSLWLAFRNIAGACALPENHETGAMRYEQVPK